jgi:hypothetical protein
MRDQATAQPTDVSTSKYRPKRRGPLTQCPADAIEELTIMADGVGVGVGAAVRIISAKAVSADASS